MIKISDIHVSLNFEVEDLTKICSDKLSISANEIENIKIIKKSVNTKDKNDIHFLLSVGVVVKSNENEIVWNLHDKSITIHKEISPILIEKKTFNTRPVIIGCGPAGLFAALTLAKAGACPILIERGEDIDKRRKCVREFWENSVLSTQSNVQFGEGGAGAFSDGKLKIGKRDEIKEFILSELINGGAPEEINYLEKPHVGTDKLYNVVKFLRKQILELGGTIHFNTIVNGIDIKNNRINGVYYENNEYADTINCKTNPKKDNYIQTDSVILAIGNSARDTFEMLLNAGIKMQARPIAIGVRIEHEQKYIEKLVYRDFKNNKNLKAADYKMVTHLANGRSVYTFCMCPGGYVIGATSLENSIVTNGMSFFNRDSKNANTALLVSLDIKDYQSDHPLAAMKFQQTIEHKAFLAGGSNYNAPVQKLSDFMTESNRIICNMINTNNIINNEMNTIKNFANDINMNKVGSVYPSYKPGFKFTSTSSYLPDFITDSLRQGIKDMDDWMPGFYFGDAILTGVESRSSSPVKILRGENLQAIGINGLYPCGEGCGYSGGIISAAVDGVLCAKALICSN